jgi:Ca2+/Na+ antiporter
VRGGSVRETGAGGPGILVTKDVGNIDAPGKWPLYLEELGRSIMMNDAASAPFRKWVLGAGIFNTIAAFPLSMPYLYKYFYAFLKSVNAAMGLGGTELIPPKEGVNVLLVNTAGLAVVLVGLMLIYASADLKNRRGIPFLNAIARLIFCGLLIYYLLVEDIARILIAYVLIDTFIACVFLYYIFRLRRSWQKERS